MRFGKTDIKWLSLSNGIMVIKTFSFSLPVISIPSKKTRNEHVPFLY